jgi:hypothetical protein
VKNVSSDIYFLLSTKKFIVQKMTTKQQKQYPTKKNVQCLQKKKTTKTINYKEEKLLN